LYLLQRILKLLIFVVIGAKLFFLLAKRIFCSVYSMLNVPVLQKRAPAKQQSVLK
jgi:hypothetical protein